MLSCIVKTNLRTLGTVTYDGGEITRKGETIPTIKPSPIPNRRNARRLNPVLGKYAHPKPAKAAPVEVIAPSPVKAIEKMVTVQTYHAYNDPGHGWIKVSLAELTRLGIADKITAWSYKKGEYAYLEEDCDYTAWVEAKTAAGEPYAVKDHYCDGRSKIRTYASYKPFDPQPATIPQAEPAPAQSVIVTAPAENPVVVAPSVTTAAPAENMDKLTRFYLPQNDGAFDYVRNKAGKVEKLEKQTYVEYKNGWAISKPVGFTPREISPEWYSVPYHHPIPGATITAGDPGKVIMRLDDTCESRVSWLAEKHGKYQAKARGYVFTHKTFANFMHSKTNG